MKRKTLFNIINKWVLIVIISSFFIIGPIVSLIIAFQMSFETYDILENGVHDIRDDVSYTYNKVMNNTMDMVMHFIESYDNEKISNKRMAAYVRENDHIFQEINIINKDGIVIKSSHKEIVGYDMASGKQSAEFLCLLNGEKVYVQSLQPVSRDPNTIRSYIGMALSDGNGFVQVGVDEKQYFRNISDNLSQFVIHRHVGSKGFFIVCDRTWKIVGSYNGKHKGKTIHTPIKVDEGKCTKTKLRLFGKDYYAVIRSERDFYIVGLFPDTDVKKATTYIVGVILLAGVLIIAVVVIVLSHLIKYHVVDSVIDLNDRLKLVTAGDLGVRMNVRTCVEFNDLSDGINQTLDNLDEMIYKTKQLIEKELEDARSIQNTSVPFVFPPFPELKNIGLHAVMETAKAVGGDFYDYFMVDEDNLCIVIADVSEKGIPAALFMMKAKTVICEYAKAYRSVERVAQFANQLLCEGNTAAMFVTVWMGILDVRTGDLSYVNA